ncbi:hypothetical protein Q6A68_07385, partial [Helicobacter pylori]|nr:hypothetical protein [Helicobacter pylori]
NIFAPYYWFIDPNARGFLLQFQNHYSPSKPYYGHAEFMLDWFLKGILSCFIMKTTLVPLK